MNDFIIAQNLIVRSNLLVYGLLLSTTLKEQELKLV